MKQCFLYLRVSSTTLVDGFGFDRQEEVCRDYASKAGFQIANVFEEDISGTKDETARPIFQDMVSAILAIRIIMKQSG